MEPVRQFIVPWYLLLLVSNFCVGQQHTNDWSSVDTASLNPAQLIALDLLSKEDTSASHALWPNIKPTYFYENIRKNILYPNKINQGNNTNFCSYAALTHLLVKYQPDNYTRMVLSLYHTGKATLYSKKIIEPSQKVREAIGMFRNHGELNILHADQLWFLTMADSFKGYLNLFDHKFKMGDENTFWAATNYKKFRKMLKEFGGYKIHAIGSDLMRPWKNKKNLYKYVVNMADTGLVMMYINNKWMYPHKWVMFNIPAPTHFVVLYELTKADDMINIKYWDYGLKTEQMLTPKRFKKAIYGVFSITKE